MKGFTLNDLKACEGLKSESIKRLGALRDFANLKTYTPLKHFIKFIVLLEFSEVWGGHGAKMEGLAANLDGLGANLGGLGTTLASLGPNLGGLGANLQMDACSKAIIVFSANGVL